MQLASFLNKIFKKGGFILTDANSKDYIIDEKYAQDNELGIWKGEFVEPYRFRRQNKN